jgi:hypothetical protein
MTCSGYDYSKDNKQTDNTYMPALRWRCDQPDARSRPCPPRRPRAAPVSREGMNTPDGTERPKTRHVMEPYTTPKMARTPKSKS